MEIVTVQRIEEGSEMEKVLVFLGRYSELSFPCKKIRRELVRMDDIPRTSAKVEYTLRKLYDKELIVRFGSPGKYEYKIKKSRP
jgi:hypothetical protein